MELISVTVHFTDSEAADRVASNLVSLKGKEIPGSRLIFPSENEFHAIDPLVITFAIGLVEGLVSEGGKQLGEASMKWLISKVREGLSHGQTAKIAAKGESVQIGKEDDREGEKKFSEKVTKTT